MPQSNCDTNLHVTSKNNLNGVTERRSNRQKEWEFEVKISACKIHIKRDLENAYAEPASLCNRLENALKNALITFILDNFHLFRITFDANFFHIRVNQITLGSNSLKSFGPKLWNSLPFS